MLDDRRRESISFIDVLHFDMLPEYRLTCQYLFDVCERIEIIAEPGESYLVDPLALHGIAPWRSPAVADADGRIICYFRPETPSPEDWLKAA